MSSLLVAENVVASHCASEQAFSLAYEALRKRGYCSVHIIDAELSSHRAAASFHYRGKGRNQPSRLTQAFLQKLSSTQ